MRGKLSRFPILAAAVLLWTQTAIAGPEASKKAESDPFKPLTVDEVQKHLTEPNVHVYDGNRDELYLEGHVPGAVHLFSNEIKEGVLPSDKSSILIFYCHNER